MSRRLAKARALHNWSWVGSWGAYGGWGGPGDAVGDEVGYGIGVVREDANGVAEEAALVGVQRGVEAVAATAFVFLWEHGTDLGRFDFAAGVYAAGENLYGDVFGSEGVEEDAGGNLYVITQRNFAHTVGDGAHLVRGSAPEFTGGNGLGALPEFGIGRFLAPLRAEIAVVELIHFERNPTAEVDTVGDMTNGNFGFRQAGPDGLPHVAAHGAMQFADGIAVSSEAESEHGHAEIFVVVVGILAAESEERKAGSLRSGRRRWWAE
jgi:hypothetical protein